ncbi:MULTISPECIES: WGR domain-containing protein [Rhizobium/Agrobacterium group]|uniref:WGR domain-containing protein n=1 Tax=Rhizobium/Agrobacterium group TaxID=227290 RepID=UPI000B4039E9|nr:MULTISPECIES: WGR domain-containing protein [Rhizobium/Agrobacterium group]MCF1473494.1 WGR domain-containing protein [Allorhizobium ampelinum]MCF1483898.1 WGR domain-containing protein [Allorhizobium ampelinum]NSZ45933.1 WGR domain-containing protein [Agrobacterium vitis]NTA29648.1 WGR domain-containing protein [Allorhizobium ampelinum]OVE88629.1 WGR domain-containing protein [Allorhizobium ampelinum]
MEKENNSPIQLRRIDPSQNMRRFYTLALQPTLFGGASVIRNWGRIGTTGQTMIETFDRKEDAQRVLSRLERTKRKRGYHDAGRLT